MKKFLLIFAVLLVAIIGGLSFLFYQSIDEESYLQQIVSSTKELTGRDMQVNGTFSIQLFPSPVIRMTDVAIKNKQGFKSPDLMKIETIEAHIQFSSLFKNPLIIENIILTKPQVFLERNATGENNWDFTFLRPVGKTVSKDDLLGQTFSDLPPQFQNIEVVNGSLDYNNALTGQQRTLEKLTGKMKSASITGPFDFTGSLEDKGMLINTTLHVDKLNVAADTKFNLSLLDPNSKAVLSVQNAKIEKLGEAGQTFTGPFTFNVPKLSSFLLDRFGYKDLPASLNQPVIGNGQFSFTSKEAALSEVAVRYGEDALENAVAMNVNFIYPSIPNTPTKVSALLRFSSLNIDMFMPYLPTMSSWENTMTAVQNNLPSDFDLVLNATQLTFKKQAVKDVSLSFVLKDKQTDIRELKATLPENTFVMGKGNVDMGAATPQMIMDWAITTTAPQKTLEWLNLKTPMAINVQALQDVQINTQMRVRPKDITFDKIAATLNKGNLAGGFVLSLTEPKLTGYAKLIMSNLNLDEFFPYTAPANNRTFMEWVQQTKNNLEKSPLLSDVNFMLNLNGTDITYKSLPMMKVVYDGKIENMDWNTGKLSITQAAQSNIEYSGSIQKLADGSLYFKDIQYTIEMPRSLLLLDRLKVQSPLPGNLSKLTVKGNFTGSFDKMTGATEINMAQGRISANGTVEKILTEEPNYALLLKIAHPNFHQFMRLFDPTFKSLPSLSGTFAFDGTVKGAPGRLSFIKANTSIGAQRLQGDLDLTRAGDKVSVSGTINSPYLYLDKFINTTVLGGTVNARTGKSQFSTELLNFDVLNDLQLDVQLAAEKLALGKLETNLFKGRVVLDEKILRLDEMKATIDGGSLDLSAVLNCSTATPFIKGNIKGDKIPVRPDLLTLGLFRVKNGDASFMLDFDAKGNSMDDMIKSLSSTGRYAIQNGAISSLNLNAFDRRVQVTISRRESLNGMNQQLNKELTVGETPFDSLEGSYAITNGVFRTSDTVLRAPNASAIAQATFDIPEWTLSASVAVTFKSFTGYPPISIVVKGAAYNPQTNIDFDSFVKYVESTSAENKNAILQAQRNQQLQQERTEAKDRISELKDLLATSEDQVLQAENAMKITSSDTAQTELIRAKDALALLQELGKKQAPSIADLEKASAQAALIKTRTQTILSEITEKAASAIRSDMKTTYDAAQEKMHAIHRIRQRLAGVELVDQAYQKAFATMTLVQQLNTFAQSSTNLDKMQQALKQANDALDIMDLTYESIAKFDVDAIQPIATEGTTAVQGTIRRN